MDATSITGYDAMDTLLCGCYTALVVDATSQKALLQLFLCIKEAKSQILPLLVRPMAYTSTQMVESHLCFTHSLSSGLDLSLALPNLQDWITRAARVATSYSHARARALKTARDLCMRRAP
jgi:hypothetical protein